MNYLIIAGIVVAVVVIIIIFIKMKNKNEDDESFLSRTIMHVNDGCAKILRIMKRGC